MNLKAVYAVLLQVRLALDGDDNFPSHQELADAMEAVLEHEENLRK